MKKRITILSIGFLLLICNSAAYADNRGVNGLIIGGGAGAIMGQAIGRNVESTVLGATVGGILGAVIASESSYRHHRQVVVHHPPSPPHGRHFNHAPRHQAPRIFYNQPHHGYKYYTKNHHFKRGHHKNCRVYHPKSHRKHVKHSRKHRW